MTGTPAIEVASSTEALRTFRLDRIGLLTDPRRGYPVVPGRRLEDHFAEMQALHGLEREELGREP